MSSQDNVFMKVKGAYEEFKRDLGLDRTH